MVVERRRQRFRRFGTDAAERDDVAPTSTRIPRGAGGQGAGRDPGGGFPGAGPLQDVPGVQPVVLEHPDQVAWPGRGRVTRRTAPSPVPSAPSRLPIGPVRFQMIMATGNPGSRGSDPGQPLDGIGLDLHAGAAPVALHPAAELVVDGFGGDRQPGRQASTIATRAGRGILGGVNRSRTVVVLLPVRNKRARHRPGSGTLEGQVYCSGSPSSTIAG